MYINKDISDESLENSIPVLSVFDIRRDNLIKLAKKQGSIAEINVALGRKRADAYLYAIVAKTRNTRGKIKNLGEQMARQIETALRLPPGYMDQAHQAVQAANPAPIRSNNAPHSAPMSAVIGQTQAAPSSGAAEIMPLNLECTRMILDARLMPPDTPPSALRWIDARVCGLESRGYLLIDIAARDLSRPGDYLLERRGLSYPVYAARRSSLDLSCGARISAIGAAETAPLAALDLTALSVVGRIVCLISAAPLP